MALNFAVQELKIDYDNSNELRVEEEKKGSPMKVHFIYYYYLFFIATTLQHFLIVVAHQAIKPQLLVDLFSFKSPLATWRLPIFSP